MTVPLATQRDIREMDARGSQGGDLEGARREPQHGGEARRHGGHVPGPAGPGETRTTDEVKKGATEVHPRRGANLDGAFAAAAYKASINSDGVAVLPVDWDDGDG